MCYAPFSIITIECVNLHIIKHQYGFVSLNTHRSYSYAFAMINFGTID